MYKILLADKDAYITNRIIGQPTSGSERVNSNVGRAGTLDLFKLYGSTFSSGSVPNTEFSRLLLHFDLHPLKELVDTGKININKNSFNCTMILSDVYGGQTTPSNFDVSVFPLSRSFSEGEGRDIVYYSDYDVCNFLSSSYVDGAWVITGCGSGGGASEICDYITGSGNKLFEKKQKFVTGEEDLIVDVTDIISSTLSNTIPDCGFRISLSQSLEQDEYSYFVKRFSSRSAYNIGKRPKIVVKYDDSIQDDTQNLRFNETSTIFLRNYSSTGLANIQSGSAFTQITGSNCLILELATVKSDGTGVHRTYFTGSQHYDGLNYFDGIYSASFKLNQNDTVFKNELIKSGAVEFTPIWSSLDGTVGYLTGSKIKMLSVNSTDKNVEIPNYTLSVTGINSLHRSNEEIVAKLHIFDYMSPLIKMVKRPIEWPSVVVKNSYYQIRDFSTNEIIIPFDDVHNSTKLSSDSSVMYFNIDTSVLPKDRSYVVDIMLNFSGVKRTYNSVSNVFSISDTQAS